MDPLLGKFFDIPFSIDASRVYVLINGVVDLISDVFVFEDQKQTLLLLLRTLLFD